MSTRKSRTKEQISFNMSRIFSRGSDMEKTFEKALFGAGIKFKKHFPITGKPDFVLVKEKVAIFCDSKFWHGYNWKKYKKQIKKRKAFWINKIEGNIKRDQEVNIKLRLQGWKVLRFWGQEIENNLDDCILKIKKNIKSSKDIPKKEIVAIDFFCGAGGLTRGLLNAGIHVVAGIDIDETAKNTYEFNNPGAKFLTEDITNISGQELLKRFKINRKKSKLLFAACAPCQPFSTQNKNKGDADKRATLLFQFARIVDECKPDFLFVENVPGLTKKGGNSTYSRFIGILNDNQHYFDPAITNARDYGVPQSRARFMLIASRKGKIKLPGKIYDGKNIPFRTVRDTIYKYPSIKAGGNDPKYPNHTARSIMPINLLRLKNTPKNGGGRESWPKELILECHKSHSGHGDTYGRMKWDKPAPTLTCKCNSISNGRYGHPIQNRAISLREAAALQTFPDNYVFEGNQTRISAHIGNAVPVRVGEVVGLQIINSNHNS